MQIALDDRSYEVLRTIAEEEHKPVETVLADLVEARRRDLYIKRVNAQYAAIRASPEDSRSLDDEMRAWDATLMDGLRDE